ncbi:MAG: thermonuclease family protein [Deinococcota bacterium]
MTMYVKMMALAVLLWLSCGYALEPANDLAGPFEVDLVVDGDTVKLETLGRIRLIGIDTPEKYAGNKLDRALIQALGERASAVTEALLIGQRVYIEQDVESRDQYGRLLGYLYIADDAGAWTYNGQNYTQINYELVQAGWAEPLTIPPNVAYADLYMEAAGEARAASLGLWQETQIQVADDTPVGFECILYNPPGQDAGQELVTLYADADTDVTGWRIVDSAGNTWELEGVLEADYLYDYDDQGEPIWNNGGDTARLFNAQGQLVDELSYAGGGVEACR